MILFLAGVCAGYLIHIVVEVCKELVEEHVAK